MNNLEALQLATEVMKSEINNIIGNEECNKLKLAYEAIEQMILTEVKKDMEEWNVMIEFLDWLNDDEFVYNIKNKMDNIINKGDIGELTEMLNNEEKTLCEEKLTDFLIHQDMNCEREKSVIVCDLIDWFY